MATPSSWNTMATPSNRQTKNKMPENNNRIYFFAKHNFNTTTQRMNNDQL